MNDVQSIALIVTKRNKSTHDVCVIMNTKTANYNGCAEYRANVPQDVADKFNPSGTCLRVKCTLYWVKHWAMRVYNLEENEVTIINAF